MALTLGALYLSTRIEHAAAVWVIASILIIGGVALVIGFLTPFASLAIGLCVLGMAFSWFPVTPLIPSGARLMTLVIVTTAVALALLGPGAFSMDGYLFGRREIVIPPRPSAE
ncbi:MAG TPA: DoxX family protein [Candidatus Acidoferrum sp.]